MPIRDLLYSDDDEEEIDSASWEYTFYPTLMFDGCYMEHEFSKYCWCDPELVIEDGVEITLHNGFH